MRVRVVTPSELGGPELDRWSVLLGADALCASPCLSAEFVRLAADAQHGVRVGILEEGGRIVGFFPHQRDRLRVGRPAGGSLNDFQGVLVEPGVGWDAGDLIRRSGLAAWIFSRVPAAQQPLHPYLIARASFMSIDLTRGYEAWESAKSHGLGLRRLARKGRKLERDTGALRFDLHDPDPRLLDRLMAWRVARYARNGYHDLFAIPAARRLIRGVHAAATPDFGALMSVLRAGDRPVAIHFGLRWRHVCHSWFIAYAPEFAAYSPGLLLYLQLAQRAPAAGIRRIVLGSGDYPYKEALMNHAIEVASGAVDRFGAAGRIGRWCEQGASAIRRSPVLRPPARGALRAYRHARHALRADSRAAAQD